MTLEAVGVHHGKSSIANENFSFPPSLVKCFDANPQAKMLPIMLSTVKLH